MKIRFDYYNTSLNEFVKEIQNFNKPQCGITIVTDYGVFISHCSISVCQAVAIVTSYAYGNVDFKYIEVEELPF